ncbi:hypothetical protein F66182_9692 [Fusarium sp. NRRL 66182]|nr:hypothetical protein F66182_9692 [Fusarium sp. NRRL 66182]
MAAEYPPLADLRKMMAEQPLPVVAPGTVDQASMAGEEPTQQARAALERFSAALVRDDAQALVDCFFREQAYWKDSLALTYHLRTLTTPGVIAASLLETKKLRGIAGDLRAEGAAQYHAGLQFVSSDFTFRTVSPAASCSGKIFLLPTRDNNGVVKWKIWVLSTRLRSLDMHPEDESLLKGPSKPLDGVDDFNTDVFIIGGGNAAVALAARLKALGVESVMSERNPQATGIASLIKDENVYKGFSLHSSQYKNPTQLKEKGVESLLIIGSANTAFDILQDSHEAGLKPTMVVRSDTYIVPVEYVTNPMSLGVYNFGVEAADRLLFSLPVTIDAALGRKLFAALAGTEPDRYKPLGAAGFPVLDSTDKDCTLMHNLVERAGGHDVDTGATRLIAEGMAGVKTNVEPLAFTESGLRFSDDSTLDADAIVWCTGFRDRDVRQVAARILGAGQSSDRGEGMAPEEIAARMDATWGLDAEGEIRGMWKRHLHLDNFWIMGGYTQQHRWHSSTLAL